MVADLINCYLELNPNYNNAYTHVVVTQWCQKPIDQPAYNAYFLYFLTNSEHMYVE